MAILHLFVKRFYLVLLLKELVSRNEQTKYAETYICHELIDQDIPNKLLQYLKTIKSLISINLIFHLMWPTNVNQVFTGYLPSW